VQARRRLSALNILILISSQASKGSRSSSTGCYLDASHPGRVPVEKHSCPHAVWTITITDTEQQVFVAQRGRQSRSGQQRAGFCLPLLKSLHNY
jgi:hypothetical protein